MGDIVQFPGPKAAPVPPQTRLTGSQVTIHCELDDSAVVTIKPCPPGETPRRAFPQYDDAWPYADALAAKYGRMEGRDGSWSRSVTVKGPEGDE